jgi:hypothetical protein
MKKTVAALRRGVRMFDIQQRKRVKDEMLILTRAGGCRTSNV